MENIHIHLSGIFEGFTGNRPREYSILHQASFTNTNDYIYNGFKLAANSPFNGPHKIVAGTKLNGLLIEYIDKI